PCELSNKSTDHKVECIDSCAWPASRNSLSVRIGAMVRRGKTAAELRRRKPLIRPAQQLPLPFEPHKEPDVVEVLLAARDDTLHYRPCTEDLDLLERELTALTGSDLLQESASIIDRFAIGTQEGEFGCEDDRKEIAVPGVLRLV